MQKAWRSTPGCPDPKNNIPIPAMVVKIAMDYRIAQFYNPISLKRLESH